MLIVVEGLDGAGKSTQVKRLKEYILGTGKELKYIHFPRYDAPIYGEMISKFLRGDYGELNQVHPQLVALIYALDRKEASKEIRDALESGKIVLLDRYVYSNIAYQCSKIEDMQQRKELMEWIFRLEYQEYNIPRPDINLFLDVPITFVESSLGSERVQDSGRDYLAGGKDIHEQQIEFQIGVRKVYLSACESDSSFIRIDCSSPQGEMLSAESIFEKIREKLPF
ncbi:MAG: dTMP kinase [Bacteroidales bacterium]|nr:dTMP kinase [Bacteroidales bacterium]